MTKHFFLALAVFMGLTINYSLAQQTKTLPDYVEQFRQAEELFELQKYAAARPMFESITAIESNADHLLKIQASFYTALCAVELEHRDAEHLLESFIQTYTESSMRYQAYFQLALFQYKKRNYRAALRSFEAVDKGSLTNRELSEFFFKSAYCYLKTDDLKNAKRNFTQLIGTQTEFSTPATYYLAHVAYLEGDYQQALQYLERIKNERAYSSIVPHYIVHILYNQGDYAEVIARGTLLYSGERNRPNIEMARMLGDSHYRLGNYKEALDYLIFFQDNNRRQPTREESFQLAFLFHANGQYAEAIKYFQPVTNVEDSLSQHAYYLLADAYVKTDQKQYAANAFFSAYRMPYNAFIREDALFNYARLSIDISADPYNESIKALNQYLTDFPTGKRRQEALSNLVDLYLTTRNYREALASIEDIKDKDERLREAYQKITFYRGIELFNDRNFYDAIAMFKKSQDYPRDRAMNANALFWTGEAYYRLSQYDLARTYFNRFLNAPGARNLSIFPMAYYNIAYSYFQEKNYQQAIPSFERFIQNQNGENPRLLNDAYLRIGDSYFITKQYNRAIDNYDRVIRMNVGEVDYAHLTKARAQGALGNHQGKIGTLQVFLRELNKSPYAPEALYEMGNTSLLINRNNEALGYFNNLINNFPNSSLVKIALMKSGLTYYNTNQFDAALNVFKKIIADYPGSPEAHEALANIRNIYVDMNRVDEFVNYSRNLPFAQITDREQDSLIYIAALNKYMEGDCRTAVLGFNNYLSRFPQGLYSLNANFYKAECELRANNQAEALKAYEAVLDRPRSEFTERALVQASRMNLQLNNYEKARDQFVLLEQITSNPTHRIDALNGQLQANTKLQDFANVITVADKLLKESRLPEAMQPEINLMAGKAAIQLKQDTKATEYLTKAVQQSPRGKFGAEASYLLAEISFRAGKYTEAENTIFDLATNYASYDFWVASGFILLSDVYRETGNIFQARQTLLSIIENYEGDDLKQIAIQKLNNLPEVGSN